MSFRHIGSEHSGGGSRQGRSLLSRITALFAMLALVLAPALVGVSALADTGGSGGGGGGTGGGSADAGRRVYQDVYDHVSAEADPITGLRNAGQGWDGDSIDYFLDRAEERIKADFEAGPGPGGSPWPNVWNGWSSNASFANGMSLKEFITDQCQRSIDEAVERNEESDHARVVALQFSYRILESTASFKDYDSIIASFVHFDTWWNPLEEDDSAQVPFQLGEWSTEHGDLEADSDGDGTYSNAEYVNTEDPSPAAQPTLAIRNELNDAVSEAWTSVYPDSEDGAAKLVSCVAMNDREPDALLTDPDIDVSKNAEDVDGVVEHEMLAAPGVTNVTATLTNTGEEDLRDLTFADSTTSGDAVVWDSVTLPDGTEVLVGGSGSAADVQAALAGVVLKAAVEDPATPADTITIGGHVNVGSDVTHADRITVTGVGVLSGLGVDDDDATEYEADEVACVGSIGDFVWEDTNENGVQDAGEAGVGGVTVKLLDGDGNEVASTTTAADGSYHFYEVACGTYSVQFTAPGGYVGFTDADQGGDDGVDSDADKTTGQTPEVTIDANNPNNNTLDAGLVKEEVACVGSIGDFVWEDTNENGVQDAGEAGVGGVTVKLLDGDGNEVASTTTAADGSYHFNEVACGTYSVQFTAPGGYVGFTDADQGGDDGVDSDADKTTGQTPEVTIDANNPNNNTLDAGLVKEEVACVGSIGDFVWEDTNKNGVQDAGEAGVGGVTVKLLDGDGNEVASTTTAADGSYHFNEVACGTYMVQFSKPDGYDFTDPNQGDNGGVDSDANKETGLSGLVSIDSEHPSNNTIDAGLVKRPPVCNATIGDLVWVDTNMNGVQDAGEAGVGGVTVKLLGADGSVVATTTTGADGKYMFENVACGTYSVEFSKPGGYDFTGKDAGGDDGVDSDADTVTGKTGTVTVDENTTRILTLDAGLKAKNVVFTPVNPVTPKFTTPKKLPSTGSAVSMAGVAMGMMLVLGGSVLLLTRRRWEDA